MLTNVFIYLISQDDDFVFDYDDDWFSDDIANNDDFNTNSSAYGYVNMQYYSDYNCGVGVDYDTKTYASGTLANTCQIVDGGGYKYSYKVQFDNGKLSFVAHTCVYSINL